MLVLVLQHHVEEEALAQQRRGSAGVDLLHPGQHGAAHVAKEAQAGRAVGQRQVVARRARVAEGVVDAAQSLGARSGAVHVLEQPDLLEMRDVAQVPHDRGHQRAVLAAQVRVTQRRDEFEGAVARLPQAAAQDGQIEGGGRHCPEPRPEATMEPPGVRCARQLAACRSPHRRCALQTDRFPTLSCDTRDGIHSCWSSVET